MRWVWKDRKLRAHAGALRYAEVVTAQPLAIQASEPVHELDGVGMEASEDLQHDRLARVAAAGGGVVRLLDQLVLLVGRVAECDSAAELASAGRGTRCKGGGEDLCAILSNSTLATRSPLWCPTGDPAVSGDPRGPPIVCCPPSDGTGDGGSSNCTPGSCASTHSRFTSSRTDRRDCDGRCSSCDSLSTQFATSRRCVIGLPIAAAAANSSL